MKRMYGEDGKEIGCIIIDMNCNMLGNLLQNTNKKNSQNVMIVDNNKRLVYHQEARYIGTQFRSDYISRALSQKNGYLEDQSGSKFISFATSEVTNWSVIYEQHSENILSNISRLKIIILATTVLCIAVAAYYAFSVSRSISEPIIRLQKNMIQVGTGDFDIDVDEDSHDEIGHLAHTFDKMVKKTKQLIQNVYQSEIYQKEAELNALQAQINPHFLYNTLQTIDMMAEAEGADAISDACQALSKIFRYSINRGQEFVTLDDELAHIRNYMIIQKLRFGKKVDIEYEIEAQCHKLLIVKLLVQPLVENAIVHGIENSIGMCTVVVRAFIRDEVLCIEVQDDGDGISKEKLHQLNESLEHYSEKEMVHDVSVDEGHRSIGLDNTNARIKLYFGEAYGITLKSQEGEGTLVELRLPVKRE